MREEKKYKIKSQNFGFLRDNFYTRIVISTIKDPNWWQSATSCGNIENFQAMQQFELGWAFRLNLANYKREKIKRKKQIFRFLPYLQETLIELQSFQSICLKIGMKFKINTL